MKKIYFSLLITVFLVLVSCGPTLPTMVVVGEPIPPISFTPAQTGTTTSTPRPTNTSTPCPQITPAYFEPIVSSPKLIYILIDKSGSYKRFTQKALNMAVHALIEAANNGDYIYISWIGINSDRPDNNLVFGGIPDPPFPLLTPSIPTLTPLALDRIEADTPTITPYVAGSDLQNQFATVTAEALHHSQTQTAVIEGSSLAETATARTNEVFVQCNALNSAQQEINTANLQAYQMWLELRNNLKKDFISTTLLPSLSPSVTYGDQATHIAEALFVASRVIETEEKTRYYESVKLIIFSDMDETRIYPSGDLNYELEGVEVLVALMYCEKSISCQERMQEWQGFFADEDVVLPVEFQIIQQTTVRSVADFISK